MTTVATASLKTVELEISLAIRKAIETKALDPTSAMSIIRKGMELLDTFKNVKGAEKKQILFRVLEQVSAGSDGILGTSDDLLPEATLKAIKAIMDGDLVGDIVDTFVAITKGAPVDTQKIMSIGLRLKTLFTGLFQCVSSIKTKSRAAPALKANEQPIPGMVHNTLFVPAPAPVPAPKP